MNFCTTENQKSKSLKRKLQWFIVCTLIILNKIITTFLTFVITKFGPIAIFVLITRTFAIYGVEHLKPAFAYVCTATIALLLFLSEMNLTEHISMAVPDNLNSLLQIRI